MFQLIVAVISIALVAALAIASIYYGGSAFNKGSLRANVTTLVNAGQQISGAQALYKTDFGGAGSSIAGLVPTYLSAAPSYSVIATNAGWNIVTVGTGAAAYDVARIPLASDATARATVCDEVRKQAGSNGSPQFFCADTTGTALTTDGVAGTEFNFKL